MDGERQANKKPRPLPAGLLATLCARLQREGACIPPVGMPASLETIRVSISNMFADVPAVSRTVNISSA
jgi:hypothetical protein